MNHGDVTGSGRHDLDVWHVRLASGETRRLTLDELDAAFHAGTIDAHTPVLPPGALSCWAPLGMVAGLDASPLPTPTPNSITPLAFDTFATESSADLGSPDSACELDAEVLALRPRRGRKILGVMTALVVVAGLGLAAFRAKPTLQRALASRDGARVAITTEARVAPTPAAPSPAPAPPRVIPTVLASALPDAPQTEAEKKAAAAEARKSKRAQQKRRK
jgi:hypothetical protein